MDILTLAGRYLRTRRIALVCVFSVAVGVMSLIVVTSLMDGVQRFYRSSVKGTMADMWVMETELPDTWSNRHFEFVRDLLKPEMKSNGGPILALAPRLLGPAIIVRGETLEGRDEDSNEGIRLLGVDFDLERKLVPLDRMLSDVTDTNLAVPESQRENPLATTDHPAIILGDNLARRLGVARVSGPGTSDLVTVFSVELKRDDKGKLYAPKRKMICRVVGCFTTGREDFDGHMAYMDRKVLRDLRFEDPDAQYDATKVYIRLDEDVDLDTAAERIRRMRDTLGGNTWKEDNRHMLTALKDQKRILVVILAFIVFVACAAILGLVWMMVVEKVRDIGILRSMGMSRGRVVSVFALYGCLLGVIGSAIGLALGLQVTAKLDSVIGSLSDVFGVEILNAEIYRFETVPTYVDPASIAMIIVGVLAASLVSSLIPALRAAFVTPIRSLRQD